MKKLAPVFVLSAGTLWGIMGIFVRKLGTYGFSSLQIACLRILFGAAQFLLITGVIDRNLLKIQMRDVGLFLGMGLISLLMFTVCYFTTISLPSLSVAAILLYTSPIWVMLMSAVFFREKITRRKLLCAAMAFGGCVLVSGIGPAAGALVLCNPAQIAGIIRTAPNPGSLLLLLIVTAFVTAVLPYLLYTVGLSNMRASAAAIMASIEPVVATAAGALVFGEALTIPAFAGIALVLAAIVVLNVKTEH